MDNLDTDGLEINFNLFGRDEISTHRRMDIIYKPCQPKQLTPYNKHLKDTECIVDLKSPKALKRKLEETIDFLGEPDIMLWYNQQRPDL